jgi:hypothetical protein
MSPVILGRDTAAAERLYLAMGDVVAAMSVSAKMDLVGALDQGLAWDDLAGDLQAALLEVARKAGLK